MVMILDAGMKPDVVEFSPLLPNPVMGVRNRGLILR